MFCDKVPLFLCANNSNLLKVILSFYVQKNPPIHVQTKGIEPIKYLNHEQNRMKEIFGSPAFDGLKSCPAWGDTPDGHQRRQAALHPDFAAGPKEAAVPRIKAQIGEHNPHEEHCGEER